MTGRPTRVRIAGRQARRTGRIRRASAGLSPARAGAGLTIVLCLGGLYGLAASPAFGMDSVRVEGARFTTAADVEARLGLARGANLFTLATDPLEASVARLPTVAEAEVVVALPDALVVRVTEREPILVWRAGSRRYLVDVEGRLFAQVSADDPAAGGLPVIEDRRDGSDSLVVGRALDPVDIDAARRLASLTPGQVGSAAASLEVAVSDENGFIVAAPDVGWSAVFGFYTPSLRTTDLIPGQVRLLRSFLANREATVERVVLASDTHGTFIPKPTASPTQEP
jgi:cell division septal protein FtsQ